MNERARLVAPCGIDCGICELYTCKDNRQMIDFYVAKGIPEQNLPCKGCNNIEGKCPMLSGACDTYSCVQAKKLSSCSECDSFPCYNLAPSADRSNVLPHNMKVFNLATIQKHGVEEFIQRSMQVKQLYYKGKMHIGAGPKVEE